MKLKTLVYIGNFLTVLAILFWLFYIYAGKLASAFSAASVSSDLMPRDYLVLVTIFLSSLSLYYSHKLNGKWSLIVAILPIIPPLIVIPSL